MKKRYILIGLLLLFAVCCLVNSVSADETIKLYPTFDGYIRSYADNWADCLAGGNIIFLSYSYPSTALPVSAGVSKDYDILRSYLYFDTENIPDNATITKVGLYLYNYNFNQSTVDLRIWNDVSLPFTSGTSTNWDGLGDVVYTSNELFKDEFYVFDFESDDFILINKTGKTYIGLTENTFDFDVREPDNTYRNDFRSVIYDYKSESKTTCPYLLINYTLPDSPECNSTNLTLYENLVNVTGYHNSSYNSSTGWKVWANYTGNDTSPGPWNYSQMLLWKILNATSTTVLKLSTDGNLAISGSLYTNTNSPPPGNTVIYQLNKSLWLTESGDLYIKGENYEESRILFYNSIATITGIIIYLGIIYRQHKKKT